VDVVEPPAIDVLLLALGFMALTFFIGAAFYWAFSKLRRPPHD
jgi:hypothetical protein